MTIRRLAVLSLCAASPALAFPEYYNAWRARYPQSTIWSRMVTLTASACNTCHHPTVRSNPGTCYREDLKTALTSAPLLIEEALALVEWVDSDGDGVPNVVEINAARVGQAGQIGYHPGLVGATGTDPCFTPNPAQAVTNQPETVPGFCYANCDQSSSAPVLNALDFSCFLNRYREALTLPTAGLVQKHYANCDGSTAAPALNALDFGCFLTRYQQGCPK